VPNAVLAPGVVTISGTASDTGGVVSMVEVSTDGGQTWRRATGTDQWSFTWTVPESTGTTTILSRATDDSVNLESPGRGVTVTYGRARVTP
jgi:Bacterial Ig domain